MARNDRVALIRQIEDHRKSRVISYICSSRQNAAAQIGDDAIRVMYDLVRSIGRAPKIDLFLYSHGGQMEVPWRVVCMLREHCDELGVLIPYHAHSAATLIALGCDEVVMGDKAELGAIDPALTRVNQTGGTAIKEDIRVEDVMSYISFLKEKAGITDAETMGKHTHTLAETLSPWVLGQLYRTHSHIRAVAQKMLEKHKQALSSETQQAVISTLAEETRSHGHCISRTEVEALGLRVTRPDATFGDLMWSLFEQYEQVCSMRDPLDPLTTLGERDELDLQLLLAWLESTDASWAFRSNVKIKRARATAASYDVKVSMSFNLNFNPPPGVDLQGIPPEVLSHLQQNLIAQLQNQIPKQLQNVPDQVREIVRKQSPTTGVEFRPVGKWVDVTSEGI